VKLIFFDVCVSKQMKKEVSRTMRFQARCKICKSELATAILFLHRCEGFSYKQLIARYKHVLDINEYNLSTHFNRHVEQSDIEEVEETKLRWAQMDEELKSCSQNQENPVS